ncbi:acyl-CoA dehydrogenase family protein [Peterkaempfera bronchialis]|uniref:Acyl-CoA dehydrogenase n=1 Tax=Peterkaempfera bronchialis TaxID=2126346 RepID=A0A345SYQ9_9ACTN|nr:acyl-CoA dehydrogenase family protein [Peterkaempfera bronchialis]AXI78864.1 acyl-CoA dehydrogenase [Peterkaempfera bronchialis]
MTGHLIEGGVAADVRAGLDGVASGLFARLAIKSAAEHEENPESALAALKATRATAMLIPAQCGGAGVSASDAVRFQLALGAMAPSVAIATTMHHYKIAALGNVAAAGVAHAQVVLKDIAQGSKLIASGGAESTPGRDLRTLGSWAVRDADAYLVTGLKRPCSLSTSMDMLSLMVELRAPDGSPEGYAQAFVEAGADGVQREPFWRSPVFLAAQSHAVRLSGVRVRGDHVFPLRGETGLRFASDCYAWFQLLISASYLGIARCLAEATAPARRADSRGWTTAVARLRRLAAVLVDAARAVDDRRPVREQLNLAVQARDQVEDEVSALGGRLLRAAGGGSFAGTGFYTALAGGLNAIAFHPPQRGSREGIGLELLDPESRDKD